MARGSRIDSPGAIHHIIIRGIERKPIFNDDQDYDNFLKRLGVILKETSTSCLAWALLTNHAHILLKTGCYPISTVMRRFLTGYAQQFNRRHNRHGHLFQNRYKSILCEEDVYLLELVRYIHLNPVRAGITNNVTELESYPRSGHAVILGRIKNDWQDTDYVLKYFGKKVGAARRAYTTYILEGEKTGHRPELTGGGLVRSAGGWSALKAMRDIGERVISDERILGSSEFVESVLKREGETFDKRSELLFKGLSLNNLIAMVCTELDIDMDLVRSSSRQRDVALARSIICVLAVDKLMFSSVDVARNLQLSPSAVSKLVGKGRKESLAKKVGDDLFDAS